MFSLVVGTAGHIDHGKSTLVRALTGIDPDRLKEEKARGITIDLGFAHAEIGDVRLAFVDVPGHERFVKNMLAGVGGIDAVLLVVAADESVMPQTREHFDICRLLGIPEGLVALTKTDLVDSDTLELTTIEVRELTAGTFMERAPMIPVSATTGLGIPALREALAGLARRSRPRAVRAAGVVRLPIDRVFSMKGFGTVVTGTLVSGVLRQDDELWVAPGTRRVKLRGLQVHGQPVKSVDAGHRVAANLGGAEVADIERGQTLLAPETIEPTRRIDGAIELLSTARPLKHGARVRFHHGTSELLGRVTLSSGAELAPGARGHVRIRLESPSVLSRGDRFILRAYSPAITIAGGEVLDPQPPRGGARTEAGRQRFSAIDASVDIDRVAFQFVGEAGSKGLSRRELGARTALWGETASQLLARLEQQGRARDLGTVIVACAVIEELARDTISDLEQHHRAEPLSEGLPREELRTRRFSRAPDVLFEHVLSRLVREGRVSGRDRLALASHRVELSPAEQHARTMIEDAIRSAGLKPASPSELSFSLHLGSSLVDRMVKLLVRQKLLVRVDDLLFHAEALAQLKGNLQRLKTGAQPPRVDVAAFKEMFGISRKYAIPLLEYLDRERVTKRVGDGRIVL